jgi:hypothetical protein
MNPPLKMFGCANNEMVGHNFVKLVPKSIVTRMLNSPRMASVAQRTGSTTLAVGQTARMSPS